MFTNSLSHTIDQSHLELLARAKAITAANVIGNPYDGWMLEIEYGSNREILIAKRGSTRVFKKFETLAIYLRNLGLNKYKVDSTNFAAANEDTQKPLKGRRLLSNDHNAT